MYGNLLLIYRSTRALHGWLPRGTSQNVPKRNVCEQKKQENADNIPDRLARSRGGFRVANAFAIARFLVTIVIIIILTAP